MTEFSCLRVGCSECGSEPLVCKECYGCLDQLSDFQLVKNNSSVELGDINKESNVK
jgi:hypothetical protein